MNPTFLHPYIASQRMTRQQNIRTRKYAAPFFPSTSLIIHSQSHRSVSTRHFFPPISIFRLSPPNPIKTHRALLHNKFSRTITTQKGAEKNNRPTSTRWNCRSRAAAEARETGERAGPRVKVPLQLIDTPAAAARAGEKARSSGSSARPKFIVATFACAASLGSPTWPAFVRAALTRTRALAVPPNFPRVDLFPRARAHFRSRARGGGHFFSGSGFLHACEQRAESSFTF